MRIALRVEPLCNAHLKFELYAFFFPFTAPISRENGLGSLNTMIFITKTSI